MPCKTDLELGLWSLYESIYNLKTYSRTRESLGHKHNISTFFDLFRMQVDHRACRANITVPCNVISTRPPCDTFECHFHFHLWGWLSTSFTASRENLGSHMFCRAPSTLPKRQIQTTPQNCDYGCWTHEVLKHCAIYWLKMVSELISFAFLLGTKKKERTNTKKLEKEKEKRKRKGQQCKEQMAQHV